MFNGKAFSAARAAPGQAALVNYTQQRKVCANNLIRQRFDKQMAVQT